MKKKDVLNLLYSGLFPLLKEVGFKLKKSEEIFERTIDDKTDSISIAIVDLNPKFIVSITMGIRLESVENIFHKFSGAPEQLQKISTTALIQLEYFTSERPKEFLIEFEKDIGLAVNAFSDVIRKKVLPCFDNNKTVKSLDNVLNVDKTFDSTQLLSKAMHSIIIARLADNPDFESISIGYTNSLSAFPDIDQKKYQDLLNNLKG